MSPKNKRLKICSLNDLSEEKISEQILKSLDNLEIEIWEKLELENGFSLKVSKKTIELRLVIKTSTKKILTWAGSLTATITGVIYILRWLMPILIEHFSNSPP